MGFGDKGAKEKKAEKAASSKEADSKAKEDAAWADNDKGLKGKADRASAKQEAADAKLAAKAERKALEAAEEEETSKLSGANKKQSTKMTQAEIARRSALLAMSGGGAPKAKAKSASKKSEGSVDKALESLDAGEEKKAGKMNYKTFEAKVLPEILEENPDLNQSQAKDRAFKMWERSPENPKNQK
eukprot:TRINITY_DN122322_c0_g1_i1.p1 TRINITY_DN122322_c0_g1~~TRINITY_DN122322_c0_g1_i1.p1  ORF type:complete len:186 (+),score=96.50 TRINITY_DN122322_c0_g1_i1:93-650(+)